MDKQKFPRYKRVTPKMVEELKRIVGERYVVFGDPEKLEPYSHDEVAEKEYAHMPEAVVRPVSAEEIAAVMKLANREKIPCPGGGERTFRRGGSHPRRDRPPHGPDEPHPGDRPGQHDDHRRAGSGHQ
jgi:hypothetical protein